MQLIIEKTSNNNLDLKFKFSKYGDNEYAEMTVGELRVLGLFIDYVARAAKSKPINTTWEYPREFNREG